MAEPSDIEKKWITAETARNTEEPPYSAMAVYATELKLVGNWNWTKEIDKFGNSTIDVLQTIKYQSTEVNGEYLLKNLITERNYEVQFVVKVKAEARQKFLVELKLIHPDGTPERYTEDLNQKPKDIWIGLKAGKFNNNQTKSNGDIKFSLRSTEGLNLKDGLIVIGVVIVPT